MRKGLYTFGALMLLNIALVSSGTAQQQKTGYVNTNQIISRMPEFQGIQQELRALSQEWRNELREMQHEIDQLKEDFTAKEILYTEEIRKEREQEIQRKVRQREQYMNQRFGPEGDYFKRQQELLEPVQRKIFDAIAVVAEQEGFDFVFDRAQDSTLLFALPAWNLNEKVLNQMGINPDDTSN